MALKHDSEIPPDLEVYRRTIPTISNKAELKAVLNARPLLDWTTVIQAMKAYYHNDDDKLISINIFEGSDNLKEFMFRYAIALRDKNNNLKENTLNELKSRFPNTHQVLVNFFDRIYM